VGQRRAIPARGILRLLRFAAIAAAVIAEGRRRKPLDAIASAREAHRVASAIVERLGIDVRVEGTPPAGLHLLVCNHRSYMDIPVLMSVAPGIFLAKREIAGWPLVGALARELGTIFVERDSRPSRKRALASMVALFPEGTTTTGPGIRPFRPGSFWAAAELGVPVVPAAIAYAEPSNAWVDDDPFVGHFLRELSAPAVEIHVRFGPPLDGRDGFALRDEAEAWIRSMLAPLDAASAHRRRRSPGESAPRPRPLELPGLFGGLAPTA
jgi:1-acyl-sn-glycerol-3-phosphate acyltransferase